MLSTYLRILYEVYGSIQSSLLLWWRRSYLLQLCNERYQQTPLRTWSSSFCTYLCRTFSECSISWGQFTYDNNPDYVQIQDNSGEIKNQGKVYWKNFRVESTPQTALNVGLSYRGPKNIFASLDMNYYNNMYLSMSPLYRTDAVLTPGMTEEDIATLLIRKNSTLLAY